MEYINPELGGHGKYDGVTTPTLRDLPEYGLGGEEPEKERHKEFNEA